MGSGIAFGKEIIRWVFSHRVRIVLLPGILWALLGQGDQLDPEHVGGT